MFRYLLIIVAIKTVMCVVNGQAKKILHVKKNQLELEKKCILAVLLSGKLRSQNIGKIYYSQMKIPKLASALFINSS